MSKVVGRKNDLVAPVWGSTGIILWDVYHKGTWVGSRRTYEQAIKEMWYHDRYNQDHSNS